MNKICLTFVMLLLICFFFSGCISWETQASYELLYDPAQIKSIRIYRTNNDLYDYNDPNGPCGELLGEIAPEQYAYFTAELTGLSFAEHHLIILFPVAVDPNFYYGNYIVKIEYQDGSCELISDWMQRKFRVNEKYPDYTDYDTEDEPWLEFLRKWVDDPALIKG